MEWSLGLANALKFRSLYEGGIYKGNQDKRSGAGFGADALRLRHYFGTQPCLPWNTLQRPGSAGFGPPVRQADRGGQVMKHVTSSFVRFSIAILLTFCAANDSAQVTGTATYSAGESSYAGAGYTATATSAPANVASAVAATADTWPMEVNSGGYTWTIFEPQSDSWDGHQLMARSAVAVRSAPSGSPPTASSATAPLRWWTNRPILPGWPRSNCRVPISLRLRLRLRSIRPCSSKYSQIANPSWRWIICNRALSCPNEWQQGRS